jgi:predicted DNA-binding protein (MmcQ/YjbR family)
MTSKSATEREEWVYVENGAQLANAEAAGLLRRSYELVFAKLTKKLQAEIFAHG